MAKHLIIKKKEAPTWLIKYQALGVRTFTTPSLKKPWPKNRNTVYFEKKEREAEQKRLEAAAAQKRAKATNDLKKKEREAEEARKRKAAFAGSSAKGSAKGSAKSSKAKDRM